MDRRHSICSSCGFTLIELLAVMGILSLIVGIAAPSYSSLHGQFQLSEDSRRLSLVLGELRSEAIRLRTSVEVVFTSTGVSWDIHDDGSTDGSMRFGRQTSWAATIPSPIVFNGLGLVRTITNTNSYVLRNRGKTITLTLNRNGFISL